MSETTKMRCAYTDDELRDMARGGYNTHRELLAYRTRYGDIDAPPKSPQPVAGDCTWLGDCEPPKSMTFGMRFLRPADSAALEDQIAELRAEVEREKRRVESIDAGCTTLCRDLDAAKTEAASYRAAIMACITRACNEATMIRTLALPLLTAEDRDVGF